MLPATIRYAKENYVNEMPLEWWERHLVGQVVGRTAACIQSPVLDLGCGMGAVSVLSARLYRTVVGLDINPVALSRAKYIVAESGLARHVWLVRASADALPFRDGSFGGAYAFEVLEHIFYADHTAVLKEMLRVLKRRTQWVGTVPFGRASFMPAHVAFFSPQTLKWNLEQHGWRVRFCGPLAMPEGYGNGDVIGFVAQA